MSYHARGACFKPYRGRNLRANRPTSIGFDMSKVECYNCHRKGHFAKECKSPKDTRRNAMTGVFKQKRNLPTMLSWHSHILVFLLTMRDNALVVLRQNLEKAEQERDYLKLKLEKFQTSSKNLSDLLVSQTNDKTGLGYNNQVFTRSMFDCDDYFTSESDDSLPPSPIYDSPQVVSAAKLPILNPNEFDLWNMRIEQYFLMNDYSLWEVILNGDSPAPIRVIEGVVQHVAPTTVKQRDNALVVLRQNLEKAEQERDDLKLKLEKFQTSSKNL
nr:ribonuclease H-like domain-containing protein [Tanacetum cinerariifolium]